MQTNLIESKDVWFCFLKEHWPALRQLAREAYAEADRGAFLVELKSKPRADLPLVDQMKYVDEEKARELWESWPLSQFLSQIDAYNPLRSILILWWDGEDAQVEALSENEDGTFRNAVNKSTWNKRERPCPKCNTVFRSVGNLGQCPACAFRFLASEFYGNGDEVKLGEPIPAIVELRSDIGVPADFDQLDRQRKRFRSVHGSNQNDKFDELVEVIFDADYQIHNGGFEQFFYNSEQRVNAILEAFARIGATEHIRLIKSACQMFPNQMPPDDLDELYQQIEQVSDQSKDEWNRLASEYYGLKVDLKPLIFSCWQSLQAV